MEIKQIIDQIKTFLKERFDLSTEKADEMETIETLRRGVVFKGTNLWILIFAVFVASLGLNMNSTAVIIGAMLISPLMGPIMGVGLGLGINDWELIKKSLRNLTIATFISLITAAIYFSITPINEARSELLARTSPTIYDILIAFFGGMAGIVAGTSKERGNVIPGVAIATALMPPLCTAGYGLATGNAQFFFGAFYLYFINSVFISLATYFGVRIMKFNHKTFLDPDREKKVRKYVTTVVVLTIIPSLWVSYNVIRENYLQTRVNRFINTEIAMGNRHVINKEVDFSGKSPKISLAIIGEEITPKEQDMLFAKLAQYGLLGSTLTISQGGQSTSDISSLKQLVLEDFYTRNENELKSKESQIELLKNQLQEKERLQRIASSLSKELKVLYPEISSIALTQTVEYHTDTTQSDTLVVALIKTNRPVNDSEKLMAWLATRAQTEKLRLVFE